MRIKKLEIFGFKSFATKQSILFGEGVTAIVGPNGCGKSNVVDALRWVMGEQNARHLRGGNMQDIIFCGSEKKAPLGFAEVTLTIENNTHDAPLEYNHYNEIEITRRLYKTGDSEYEINRQKARLKDISDFFLGTGVGTKAYSIIEQGRVNDVISAKPIDRRLIIEEAAGITKYKAKKAAAERRMEATRTNLNRIVDIKNEIDKRVSALAREKEKLEKVQTLRHTIRNLDLHMASHKFLASSAELTFQKNSQAQLHASLSENKRDFACAEQNFATILSEYSRKNDQRRLLEELETQHKNSLELLKKDLEYTKATLTDNQLFVTRISAQLDDIHARAVELNDDIQRLTSEHERSLAQFTETNTAHANKVQEGYGVILRRQNNVTAERDTQKKIVEAATRAARLQTEISVLRDQEAQKQTDIKNANAEMAAKREELSSATNHCNVLNAELEAGFARRNSLQADLSAHDQRLQAKRDHVSLLMKQRRTLEEQKIAQSSRLKSLKEIDVRFEWSESGVSDLLESDLKPIIKAVVADILHVKPGHEDAVERCLSHLLDAAVLATNDDLKSAARFLRENKCAKTAFFVLSNYDVKLLAKPIGLVCLSDLITVNKPEYENLLIHFSRFFLANNLNHAIDHWPAARVTQATIVSLEGELLLPDGRAIILGQDDGKGVLKRKNELIELEKALSDITTALDDLSEQIQQCDDAINEMESERETILEELRPLGTGIVRLEETLKQKQSELIRTQNELKKLEQKHEELTKTMQNADEKIAALHKNWADALEEHKNQEEALEAIRDEKALVDAEYESYQQKIKEMEIVRASTREKTDNLAHALTQAKKNLDHVSAQRIAFTEQLDEKNNEELKLKENERQIEKKMKALAKDLEETTRILETLRVECHALFEKKSATEALVARLQAVEQGLLKKIHEHDLTINTINNHIKNLFERIFDRYRLNLAEHITDFHRSAINEEAAKKEMDDSQRQLDRIGAVNEHAAREYDEFSARSKFLESQVNDLNDALNQLESAIKKINKTTKMRFLEAFTNINKQFSIVFPRLFNGGHATLVLSDEEDLLNCGVDIIAKPPGKNISSIELMSGGEKALTAISLIMAIFLIKPSPFCLLDEVDAPLDETNVARYSHLVKEMSELSQFIVITHNRKTMESADQLYGVTMEDAGQSKIVSVHVQQAYEALKQNPGKAGAKKDKSAQLTLNNIVN